MIALNQLLLSFEIPLKYDHEIKGASTNTIYLKPYKYFKLNSILKLDRELELFFRRKVLISTEEEFITFTINLRDEEREFPKLNLDAEVSSGDAKLPHGDAELPLHLGIDNKGKDVAIKLSQAPHMIVAGTTGSGKSVCLRNIIKQLESNDMAKYYFLDGKTNELDEINNVLDNMIFKMEYRYNTFSEYDDEEGLVRGTCDIDYYNKHNEIQLKKYVVIIDEFADVIMQDNLLKKAKYEIEKKVVRLCQKARAAGIHIILTTQRPDAKTLSGLIRANCPTRIALKCTTGTESRIILDEKGAEKLNGKGDMLIRYGGDLIRCQGYC